MRFIADGNKIEVYFPYNDVLIKIMKTNKFSWDKVKKCWYKSINYSNVDDIVKFINNFNGRAEIEDEIYKLIEKIKKEREQKYIESRKLVSDIHIPLPEGKSLYPYQKAGVEFLMNRKNCLLADQMGLGKTIQVIAYLNTLEKLPRTLIVSPLTLLYNWKKEIDNWLIHNYSIFIGDKKIDKPLIEDIVLITYDRVKNSLGYLKDFSMIVLDESHYIKNYKSQRTKAILELVKINHDAKIIALTGTPILNRPIELFPILQVLRVEDKELSDFWLYVNKYCGAKRNEYGWDFSGATNIDELAFKLRTTIMLRREKKDVLEDLPDKIRTIIPVRISSFDKDFIELEQKVKEIIGTIEKLEKQKEELREKGDKEKLKEIRQEIRKVWYGGLNYIEKYRLKTFELKKPFALEFIENLIEQKNALVIFVYRIPVAKEMEEELKKRNFKVGLITGEISSSERFEITEKFQKGEYDVIVATIRSAAEGLTLTKASDVLFLEYDWNLARMEQAEDRVHRIGQKNNVNIYWIAIENSIDYYFINKIIEKAEIFKKLMEDVNEEQTRVLE